MVTAIYWAAKPMLMPFYAMAANLFTHKPDSLTVSIGSFDQLELNGYIEVANQAGNRSFLFSMSPIVYRILNAIGQAEPIEAV